jgi:hypothetical protein
MRMSSTLPQGINIAQLLRSGMVLHPSEVVALVHALCDQEVCVPTADKLWITHEGQVIVHETNGAPPLLATMGALIETLLPPFSEERRYAPAASLHMLPARLRGAAGPRIVSTRELLKAIQHYETDASARVLQHLFARVTAAKPERPASTGVDGVIAPDRRPSGHVSVEAPESAATAVPRSPTFALLALLCVGMGIGLSGYGTYWPG